MMRDATATDACTENERGETCGERQGDGEGRRRGVVLISGIVIGAHGFVRKGDRGRSVGHLGTGTRCNATGVR